MDIKTEFELKDEPMNSFDEYQCNDNDIKDESQKYQNQNLEPENYYFSEFIKCEVEADKVNTEVVDLCDENIKADNQEEERAAPSRKRTSGSRKFSFSEFSTNLRPQLSPYIPTGNMFDTERFIIEVQNRSCLWNLREKAYSDRDTKRKAWKEIANIFNDEWSSYSDKKKKKTIDDLQKKWKHLRDYFVRERKKEKSTKSGKVGQKKRKTRYIEMLRFLKAPQDLSPTEGEGNSESVDMIGENLFLTPILTPTPEDCESSEQPTTSCEQHSTVRSKKSKMTSFQEILIQFLERDKLPEDPNKNFLMSLLPEIQTMTEVQNFEFRFEVMNLLRRIKYPSLKSS